MTSNIPCKFTCTVYAVPEDHTQALCANLSFCVHNFTCDVTRQSQNAQVSHSDRMHAPPRSDIVEEEEGGEGGNYQHESEVGPPSGTWDEARDVAGEVRVV